MVSTPEETYELFSRLKTLPLPEGPSWWWPLGSGWWCLLLGLALAGGLALLRAWRRHWSNRYRRQALARVCVIEAALAKGRHSSTMAVELLAILLDAVEAVEGTRPNLVGVQWQVFLDERLPEPHFDADLACLVSEAPYRPLSFEEMTTLSGAIRLWLERHCAAV